MFFEALRACHEALAGKLVTEEARQAFIEAALEAGIYVREVPLRGEWPGGAEGFVIRQSGEAGAESE